MRPPPRRLPEPVPDPPAPARRWPARVITVSDSVTAGTAVDRSGPAVAELLAAAGFDVADPSLVADGIEPVAAALVEACAGFAGLVVTTGGTGFGPRDLTPEATATVLDREAPGLVVAMALANPAKAALSRPRAGTRGQALVVNLPGSVKGATECLAAVVESLPHALALLSGESSRH